MDQTILQILQLIGVGGTAMLMFIWTMRYSSKAKDDVFRHREEVEAQTRKTLNEIALSQSQRADRIEDILHERERLLTEKQLEIMSIGQNLQRAELLLEDSQHRLKATESVLAAERGKIDGLNAVISRMGQQMDLLKGRITQIETDAASKLQNESALRADLSTKITRLETEKLKLADRVEDLEHFTERLQHIVDGAAKQHANDEEIIATLTAEKTGLEWERETLLMRIDQQQVQIDALSATNSALSVRVEQLIAEVSRLQQQLESVFEIETSVVNASQDGSESQRETP